MSGEPKATERIRGKKDNPARAFIRVIKKVFFFSISVKVFFVVIPRAWIFWFKALEEVDLKSWKKNMLENRIIIRADLIVIIVFCMLSGIETSMDLNHRF